MKALTGFGLCMVIGLILAGPVLSMQSREHRDPDWPDWLAEQQPIEQGSLNFITNLEALFYAFIDAQEKKDLSGQITCFERSWWQLRSMWNLEIKRPKDELLVVHFEVMREITRRLAAFSDNLRKYIETNKSQNWRENRPMVGVVNSLLATVGSSSCGTDKTQQCVADNLSHYQTLANLLGGEVNHKMVRAMIFSLQDANRCNADLGKLFYPADYRE